MIVLDYKEEKYKKIISNSKRHKKYYIEKIEEITNEKIINLMENIINNLSELIMDLTGIFQLDLVALMIL